MNLKKKLCFTLMVGIFSTTAVFAAPKKIAQPIKMDASVFESTNEISFDGEALSKLYKEITKDDRIMEALEMMKGNLGEYSRKAILGDNLTGKKMKIEFKNLSTIKPEYANFDALGWKRSGRLMIYINEKHSDAPAGALAALLAHEALHQDEFDSLNEETYAWTLEAAVWTQIAEKNSGFANVSHPLVQRENMLKKLFEKGDYTNKYIKKAVFSNPGYQGLPSRSPGFESEDL